MESGNAPYPWLQIFRSAAADWAGVALSGGGLKFLELFGYFLFQDKK
jgi:hypothetical protein